MPSALAAATALSKRRDLAHFTRSGSSRFFQLLLAIGGSHVRGGEITIFHDTVCNDRLTTANYHGYPSWHDSPQPLSPPNLDPGAGSPGAAALLARRLHSRGSR